MESNRPPKTEYNFLAPSSRFAFLVRNYISIWQPAGGPPLFDKYIPDGSATLVFNFEGEVRCFFCQEGNALPPFFLIAPLTQTVGIEVNPPCRSLVIVCNSSQFSRFFNLRFDQLADEPYHPASFLGGDALWQKMKEAGSPEKQICVFEEFIQSRLGADEYTSDKIDQIYDYIVSEAGEANLDLLQKKIGISPRTFRRQFLARTGMNAKTLCRIMRFQRLWDNFLTTGSTDMQEMVFTGHFYDQPHLIRDFKKLVGELPGEFFKRDQEAIRIISGKKSDSAIR